MGTTSRTPGSPYRTIRRAVRSSPPSAAPRSKLQRNHAPPSTDGRPRSRRCAPGGDDRTAVRHDPADRFLEQAAAAVRATTTCSRTTRLLSSRAALRCATRRFSGRFRCGSKPDISMDADAQSGMLIGLTQTFPDGIYYDQFKEGGTSLASPLLAGVIADADQAAGTPWASSTRLCTRPPPGTRGRSTTSCRRPIRTRPRHPRQLREHGRQSVATTSACGRSTTPAKRSTATRRATALPGSHVDRQGIRQPDRSRFVGPNFIQVMKNF